MCLMGESGTGPREPRFDGETGRLWRELMSLVTLVR